MANYIIWDVDGVLNPGSAVALNPNFQLFSHQYIRWRLNIVEHGEWLRDLESYSSFVWGSAWEKETDMLCEWFGLREKTYPFIPLPAPGDGNWKQEAILEWVAQNTTAADKVVVVDDELNPDGMRKYLDDHSNFHLIQPDPKIGFTREHYATIQAFFSC